MGTPELNLSDELRTSARAGVSPSRMLRDLVSRVGPARGDRQFLVRLVSDAFQFSEGEGYVVFGWLPDGSGELSDGQLDALLSRRIQAARPQWDVAERRPTT